jgi:hypothetical protein
MREKPGSDENDRRPRDSNVAFDEAETLIQKPDDFEDYEEFSEDTDASPDDRRRDPLRRKW